MANKIFVTKFIGLKVLSNTAVDFLLNAYLMYLTKCSYNFVKWTIYILYHFKVTAIGSNN